MTGDDLSVAHDGLFGDAAHAQDGGLGQVDDGGEGIDVVHAQVGDGEGAAAQSVGRDAAGARPLGQLAELGPELAQAFLIGIANDGHEQSPLGVDGHAHVDGRQVFDRVGG